MTYGRAKLSWGMFLIDIPARWLGGVLALAAVSFIASSESAQTAEPLFFDDVATIIIYDQEGRPGKWALTPAPKIKAVGALLRAHDAVLSGRDDVSLRRASTGKSGDKARDCASAAIDAPFGSVDLEGFIGSLAADGHQSAPTAALEQAVADLQARGGGRIVYFTDTVSSCDDDPLWVAEQTGPDIAIDVVALGDANRLHGLAALALASGGNFFLIEEARDLARLGGPMIDEALPEGGSGGSLEVGKTPPGDLPPLEGEGGETSSASMSGPLFSDSGSGGSLRYVDTGTESCPAFDAISKGLLEYTKGLDPDEAEPLSDPVAIAFILDASGSMAARQGGKTKMSIAKTALSAAVRGIDGANVVASLRAYGFDTRLEKTAAASCPNTAEIVPFGKNQARRIAQTARALTAYGYTPLAASLSAAGESLQSVPASRRIAVLISDGEETCGGDPVQAARDLSAAGVDVSTYVVGYDLDAEQRQKLEAVARSGGTEYLDASDSTSLARVLKEVVEVAIEKTERIAPSCENPVKGGDTPETATLLPPGIYTVGELLEAGIYRYYRVASEEGQLGHIRGLIQSRQFSMTDDGPRENAAAPTAMTIDILYPDGSPTRAQAARGSGIPGTAFDAYFADTEGKGFIFGIGDNYRLLSPNSLFQISLLPFVDGESGDAGADPKGGDVALIGASGVGAGHIGREDVVDVWRHAPDAAGKMSVSLALENPKLRYRLSVFDEGSGKRIGRGNNKPVKVDISGPIRILIESRSPSLRPEFSAYSIEVRHD